MSKPVRYLAKCKACDCVTSGLSAGEDMRRAKDDAKRAGSVYTHSRGSIVLDCRKCGEPRYAHSVRGTFSAKHVCAAKCMSSTGTVCECSCAEPRRVVLGGLIAVSRSSPTHDSRITVSALTTTFWSQGQF